MVKEIAKKRAKSLFPTFKKLKLHTKLTLLLIIILIIALIVTLTLIKQKQDNRQIAQTESQIQLLVPELTILISNWEKNDTSSDLNNDNIVNIVDLSILLSDISK